MADVPPETLQAIAANTELVIQVLGPNYGPDFGLNAASIEWLDGFIERQRGAPDRDERMVSILGSFLGDAIIAAGGGAWSVHDHSGLGVRFTHKDWCFPFAKVEKQFRDGRDAGESIDSFYDICVNVLARGLALGNEAPA